MADRQVFKYLKLGKGASSFYDQATKLYIVNDQVIKIHPAYLSSKKTEIAKHAGHIVEASEAEYKSYVEKANKAKFGSYKPSSDEDEDSDDETYYEELKEEFLGYVNQNLSVKIIASKFNKGKLLDLAKYVKADMEEVDEMKSTKVDITNIILDALHDSEEDEDENEE